MDPRPPSPAPTTPPQAARRHGWAHRLASGCVRLVSSLLWLLGAGLALLTAGLLAFVLWASTPLALPQTLKWAQEWLTDADSGDSPLTVQGAKGSLTTGGRIERLQWRQNGLAVEIESLSFAWSPNVWMSVLLKRDLTIEHLAARHIQIRDERPDTPDDPITPPERLAWPWLHNVSLPVRVDSIAYAGPTTLESGRLVAHYRYGSEHDAPTHRLRIDEWAWADGQYRIEAHLLAVQPLFLQVDLEAAIDTPEVAEVPAQTLAMRATVRGHLGGDEAEIEAQADVRPAGPPQSAIWKPELRLFARLRPWADMPIDHVELRLQDINLAQFWPQAPATRLDGNWLATHLEPTVPDAWRWQLEGHLRNRSAHPWNEGGLPLDRIDVRLELQPDRGRLHTLRWVLGTSHLDGEGEAHWHPNRNGQPWMDRLVGARGRIDVRGLAPHALWSTLPTVRVDARAQAAHGSSGTQWSIDLKPQQPAGPPNTSTAPPPTLQAQGIWSGRRVRIDGLLAEWLDSRLQASADILTGPVVALQGQGHWEAPGLQLRGDGAWPWTGQPVRAAIDLSDAERFQQWARRAVLALDAWLPELQAPARTGLLWQTGWRGQARLDLATTGPGERSPWPSRWTLAVTAPRLEVQSQRSSTNAMPALMLQQARLDLSGESSHWTATLRGAAALVWPQNAWKLDTALRLSGDGLPVGTGSSGRMRWETANLEARREGTPLGARVQLAQPLDIELSPRGDVLAGAGALTLQPWPHGARLAPATTEHPARIEWSRLHWTQGRIETQGRAGPVALSWANAWWADATRPEGPLTAAGFSGDLLLEGTWDLSLPMTATSPAPARAHVQWRHLGGDLTYLSGSGADVQRTPVELESLQADATLQGDEVLVQAQLQTRQFGRVQGRFTTRLTSPASAGTGWAWPQDAPVEGQLQARLTRMAPLSSFAPPGWRIDGEGQADARILGTRTRPDWQGQIELRQLVVRSALDGIEFSNGQLLARLNGDQMSIERLQLRGAGGTDGGLLTGQGRASWNRAPDGTPRPEMTLSLQAQTLRLLARADRRLTLSGRINSRLTDGLLDLTGRLDVDQALFLLPDETAPSLGRDVVIRGSTMPMPLSARLPFRLRVRSEVNLGERFEVRGLGLQTALQGRLLVEAQPGQLTPTLTGQVRTVRGSYRAYGQRLQIEHGLVRFNGPYDNPSLDILALRPHPTQKVGVEIGGTAQSPRVRLYADPDLPDSEKLAWLVLGRPASGAGAEAAVLQQAALALLSGDTADDHGSLAQRLGLDDLSFQGETVNPDGTATAAAFTLGKRLSEQLYVSYSRSVVGAVGTVAVFLDLSRHLTLRAQAGDDNAVDIIFTHSFDGQRMPRTISDGPP